MSSRYLIIHGHFYQPPRENPWILSIEPQDSAAPYDNWNLKIDRECYAANCRSRLLDSEGRISRLINNYEHLNFNFGPTLLSWMEKGDSDTYGRIIAADGKAAEARSGHGPALAQVYNHIIMPLANSRDKLTQIRWGLNDFKNRFSRQPEGMWLAETAVDLESLQMMAAEGLKFTILSQGQASAVRPLGGGEKDWRDVSGGRIDPREPYRVFWGRGPKDYLDVFFYDGPVSRAIAFEQLLRDGATLLNRIEDAFGSPWERNRPRLVNLATDGESYGHHFAFGDMALAWLFNKLEENSNQADPIVLTNYGEFLSLFPPEKEVRIFENSSWSCAHGVERWRSDCGCNTGGGHGKWNQKWRAPLRKGLDQLRDHLAEIFESRTKDIFNDPWAARDEYLWVFINHYHPLSIEDFFKKQQSHELSSEERQRALSLLEAQLMALYMFTSCGWFFDEISGLEPVQNLRYALRAIELTQTYSRDDLAASLAADLKSIVPNNRTYADGVEIWTELVLPDSLSDRSLAAHWAAAAILKVPEAKNFFTVPKFRDHKLTRLSGENIDILAALLESEDPRLGSLKNHICLAIYSGSTHLAILVGDHEGGLDEGPDWLAEETLNARLGGDLKAPAALNIWEMMLKLMPRTSRFVLEDLLPHCRGLLLATMVNDVYDDLKNRARDIFHLNQHLLMMNRAAGKPPTWEERFIFRVMGESEIKRLLTPAEKGLPINLGALTNLFTKKGLVGLIKDKPLVAELGHNFFHNIFSSLIISKNPGRVLHEITDFLNLIEREQFNVDLWEIQNQWHELARVGQFTSRLTPEEKKQMEDLGLALGFALSFIERVCCSDSDPAKLRAGMRPAAE